MGRWQRLWPLTEGSLRKSEHNYAKARELRRQSSRPEGLPWRELKAKKAGLKFRRQHPFGPFVLDFYCAAAKLGVEIDGIAHDLGDRCALDMKRDAWLREQGIELTRIAAKEVLADPTGVSEAIVAMCRERI